MAPKHNPIYTRGNTIDCKATEDYYSSHPFEAFAGNTYLETAERWYLFAILQAVRMGLYKPTPIYTTEVNMAYQYSVGFSPSKPHNKAVILHKKPSEIPYGIDQDLIHKCGSFIHFLDGPNNRVYYEACGKNKEACLVRMQEYLDRCGWEKIPS